MITSTKGATHFDIQSCRVCGRESCQARGGEGTRANTTTQHFIQVVHRTQHSESASIKGATHLDTQLCGVCGRESCQACGGEGTRAITRSQNFSQVIQHKQHSQSQAQWRCVCGTEEFARCWWGWSHDDTTTLQLAWSVRHAYDPSPG